MHDAYRGTMTYIKASSNLNRLSCRALSCTLLRSGLVWLLGSVEVRMLSRLALRNAQMLPTALRGLQKMQTSSEPERPKRLIDPPPVRHGFIPENWFTFFYPKTGASGPYMFLLTFGTYLVSKEFYVLEHEYYNGLSLLVIWIIGVKKFGPAVRAYLTKEQAKMKEELDTPRQEEIKDIETCIKNLETEQWRTEAQKLIFDAKKQNILIQLEAIYRERVANAYSEVKKRLDYHVQLNTVERRLAQKHMVQWVLENVMKAITPDQEKAMLQQCVSDLQALAKA